MGIGLPVFNGAGTLTKALDSLLQQTHRDLEIVVSDNASTDDTPQILAARASDPRLRVFRQPSTLSMVDNFEFVLRQSRGRHFMWAAADDTWDPRFVETLLAALRERPSAGVAMSSVELVDPSGSHLRYALYDGADALTDASARSLFRRMAGLAEGASPHLAIYGLYRREVLEAVLRRPFPTAIAGDRVLMCEIALTTQFVSVPEVLYRRTVNEAPLDERYPQDRLALAWRPAAQQWRYLLALLRRTASSSVVPLRLKLSVALPTWGRLVARRRHALIRELRVLVRV